MIVIGTVLAATSAAQPRNEVLGWVSDESCGALHTSPGGADCVKKCIKGATHLNPDWTPQRMVLVVEPSHEIWVVFNPSILAGYESRRVRVVGKFDERAMTVEVMEARPSQPEEKGAP